MRRLLIFTIDVETWQPIPPGHKIDWKANIVEPLAKIEALLKQHHQRAVLMVETVELLWLRENNPKHYDLVMNQLRAMSEHVEYGLHIHPAWRNAAIVKGVVNFKDDKYLLDLPYGEALDLLQAGSRLIKDELGSVPRSYRGAKLHLCEKGSMNWKRRFDMLTHVGIKVDSSVLPGIQIPEWNLDYKGCPMAPYYPDPEDIRKDGKQQEIREYPISVLAGVPLDLKAIDSAFLSDQALPMFKVMLGHSKTAIDWKGLETFMKKDKLVTFGDIEGY